MAAGSTATSSSAKEESDDADRSEETADSDEGGLVSSTKSDNKANKDELDNDDNDDILNSSPNHHQQNNDYEWEKKLLETFARISLASMGGGLVGLSLDHTRQQQQQQQQHQQHQRQPKGSHPSARAAASSTTAVRGGNRPRQPRQPANYAPGGVITSAAATSLKRRGASLAKTWSVSCFLFAAILETTRWISPATVLYDFILQQKQQQQQQQQGEDDPGKNLKSNSQANTTSTTTTDTSDAWPIVADHSVHHHDYHQRQQSGAELQRVALTVTGDYTIGGTMAGFMVASLAHQKYYTAMSSSISMPPRPVFGRAAGVGLGTALGLCAGLLQATIAVGEVYIQQRQQQPEQQR